MLILFDIDATLITTGGVGVRAMADAGRELHGEAFTSDGVEFSGRLDPLILADLLVRNGREPTRDSLEAMRGAYRRHLVRCLAAPGDRRMLPGVGTLLDALGDIPGLTLGLLTGNFADTGSMKLRACGIDPERFGIRVWGDESPHEPPARDHLPPVAMARYRERFGRDAEPSRVTIIGDTVHDVRCARAHGCRALAVATGRYSLSDLASAGAHHAVPTLADTPEILAWLLSPGPRR